MVFCLWLKHSICEQATADYKELPEQVHPIYGRVHFVHNEITKCLTWVARCEDEKHCQTLGRSEKNSVQTCFLSTSVILPG